VGLTVKSVQRMKFLMTISYYAISCKLICIVLLIFSDLNKIFYFFLNLWARDFIHKDLDVLKLYQKEKVILFSCLLLSLLFLDAVSCLMEIKD
jgi:hypothetical protein